MTRAMNHLRRLKRRHSDLNAAIWSFGRSLLPPYPVPHSDTVLLVTRSHILVMVQLGNWTIPCPSVAAPSWNVIDYRLIHTFRHPPFYSVMMPFVFAFLDFILKSASLVSNTSTWFYEGHVGKRALKHLYFCMTCWNTCRDPTFTTSW